MKPQQILDLEKYWGIEIKIGEFGLDKNQEITELYLTDNQIPDLSPLSALSNLTKLNLASNQINALLGDFESPQATQQAIYQTFNINGNFNDMRGAGHIQFIRNEAQVISSELSNLIAENQAMSEANKDLLDKLIADLQALQKAENPAKSKGIMAQLKETVKNLPKIASEEAIKWATKKGLDGIDFNEKFSFIQEKLVNLLNNNSFQDFVKPDNWV